MGILLSVLLVVLGLLGAEVLVSQKIPASRNYYLKIEQYREIIGCAGLVLGAISLIEWIIFIPMMKASALSVLISLIATVATLGLGLIFSFDFIRNNLKNPTAPILVKVGTIRSKIIPFQQVLGIIAIVVGILDLFYSLWR